MCLFTKNDRYTRNNHCPKRTGHVGNLEENFKDSSSMTDVDTHAILTPWAPVRAKNLQLSNVNHY